MRVILILTLLVLVPFASAVPMNGLTSASDLAWSGNKPVQVEPSTIALAPGIDMQIAVGPGQSVHAEPISVTIPSCPSARICAPPPTGIPIIVGWFVAMSGYGSNDAEAYAETMIPNRNLPRFPEPGSEASFGGLLGAGMIVAQAGGRVPQGALLRMEFEQLPTGLRAFAEREIDYDQEFFEFGGVGMVLMNRVPFETLGFPPWGDAKITLTLYGPDGRVLERIERMMRSETRPDAEESLAWLLDADRGQELWGTWQPSVIFFANAEDEASMFRVVESADYQSEHHVFCSGPVHALLRLGGIDSSAMVAARAPDAPCSDEGLAPNEPFIRWTSTDCTFYDGMRGGEPRYRVCTP